MVFFVAPGCVKRRRGDHDTRNGLTGSKTKTNPTVLYLLKLQSKLHHHYNMYTKDCVIYTTLDSGISSVWHYTPKNVKNSTCQETCPRFCFTFRSPSAENSIRIHVKVHITDAWHQIGKLEKFTFEWETSIHVHFFLFAKDVLYLGAKEVSSSSNHLDHDQGIITYHTWLVYCTECIVKIINMYESMQELWVFIIELRISPYHWYWLKNIDLIIHTHKSRKCTIQWWILCE